MKKAVILTGGKQYLVSEGETLSVEVLKPSSKTLNFTPLLIINDGKANVGTPEVASGKVNAEVVEELLKADKVVSIRYKAKKRVRKTRGHRQHQTKIKITKITV